MRSRSSIAAMALGTALWAGASLPILAQQQPASLSPELPENGAAVGKKPRFVIRVAGSDVEKLRFRIQLSADDFETIAYSFDQVQDAGGWASTVLADASPAAAYFTRQALRGGDYLWRVASWDGLSWKTSGDRFRIRIDDVPPADVDGVTMHRDARTDCLRVRWKPVTVDRDGRPERVALYHVYRYEARGPTQPIRPFEAGSSPNLEFDDCAPAVAGQPILFYRVVAEDEAGNIAGRKF